MAIKKLILTLGLVSSSLLASDLYMEVNYGAYDGKAKSYQDSADDRTDFPSMILGQHYDNLRVYLSYDHLKWEDAKAQDLMINLDYVIGSKSLDYYIGAGVGKMKFEADDIKDTQSKTVGSIKAGINYSFTKTLYLNTGLRYLYTNDIEIRDEDQLYSYIENMLGLEVGIGVNF